MNCCANKWWLLGLLALLAACRSTFFTTTSSTDSSRRSELLQQTKALVSTETNWSLSYTLDVPHENLSVEGKVRVVRDSLILFTVKKLGIEAMRVMFTPDSAWILDRIKNKYFEGSYSSFERLAKVPIDYHLIQSVFLNEPYASQLSVEGCQPTDSLLFFRSSVRKDSATMDLTQVFYRNPLYLQGFRFASTALNTEAEVQYRYGKKLELDGFVLRTNNKHLPEAVFQIKKLDSKDRMAIKFKIPKRYERIVVD